MNKHTQTNLLKSTALLTLAVLIALTSVFQAVTPAQAQSCQYWIAPAGNNANPGTTQLPWATLDYAAAQVLRLKGTNCTVWAKDGVYNGGNDIKERFSTMITFKAVNPYKAVIQHAGAALDISGGMNMTFEGFEFRHSGPTTNPLVVYVSQSNGLWAENIVFRNNVFHDSHNNDILKIANGSRFITVEGNVFYNQGDNEQHMDVNGVTDVTIQDNIFFNDFAGSGRANNKGTKHFIVIKDSSGSSDGILGAQRITLRRNIFMHFQGAAEMLVQIGNDGEPYHEANNVRLENNLVIGNNPDEAYAAFGVAGAQNVSFVNNTIVGNFPTNAYAYRIVIKEQNPVNQNITFYNNIWSDPTGTMGSGLSGVDNDFSSGNASSVSGFVLNRNLYWNGNAAIPDGDVGSPLKTDPNRVVANPLLNTNQNGIALPRWNGSTFLSGSTSIRQEFLRLVNQYGQIPAGSPAIDKADPSKAPTTDILGQPRGAAPDMGAFEFQGGGGAATAVPTQTAVTAVPSVTVTNPAPASPTSVTPLPVTPIVTLPPAATATSTIPPTPTQPTSVPPTATQPTSVPPTATQPSVAADPIFADSFEAGNFSAWSANRPDSGDLSVSPEAALAGANGMKVVIDDNNTLFVTDDRPSAEAHYRARFYMDPNSLAMASGESFYLLNAYLNNSTAVARLEFAFANGGYQIRARAVNDGTKWLSTPWVALSDAPHFIEFDWKAASAAGANDGALTLWIDGQPAGEVTGIDNDTRRVEQVRLGAVYGVQAGTRGVIFLDAFESRRQSFIGPVQ
ncbi:MAG TPA: choice-of-anchor Q domain-containing protein [Anaerolineales bacterium]|nr:choice-of-anchor Q domain-containing protein [Anaerolineales bacterium]